MTGIEMANIYTGFALAVWVSKSAAKSTRYKVRSDGTAVFRMHTIVGIYGLIGMLGIAACTFIPDTAAMLLMIAIIGLLFIPFFLYYLFARLYINDEKIAYRNPLGKRREIVWEDLNAAIRLGSIGDILLLGNRKAIRLYPYFSGFSVIKEKLHQYRPEAFDSEYMRAHAKEFQQPGSNGHSFRWNSAYRMVGLIIMLFGFAFLLLPNRMFGPAYDSQFIGKLMIALIFIICGLSFFLMYANMSLYIDDEIIVYKNVLGITKQVFWKEVSSFRIFEKGVYNHYIRIYYGDKKKITISNGFCGYEIIKHIIIENGRQRKIRFW
jgi:hypothetical protein